jgi:hypothetical protein
VSLLVVGRPGRREGGGGVGVRTGVYSWGGVWIVVVLGGGMLGRRVWCACGIARNM